MSVLSRGWFRWVAFTGRPIDSRPLVLVRAGLAVALLGDLLAMAARGAAGGILYPARLGGIGAHDAGAFVLGSLDHAGPALWVLLVATLPMVVAGVWTRPAIVVAMVASAQLGHMFHPGDRGIDRLIRTAFLILACSRVCASPVPRQVPGWTDDLLRWLLVMVYTSAGVAKLGATFDWVRPSATPPVYRILTAPLHGTLDPAAWYDHAWLFTAAGIATIVVEVGAPVILVRRWAPWWALVAMFIHLGIAFTMKLGMFSWGMLAFYPMLFGPWLTPLLDRLDQQPATGSPAQGAG